MPPKKGKRSASQTSLFSFMDKSQADRKARKTNDKSSTSEEHDIAVASSTVTDSTCTFFISFEIKLVHFYNIGSIIH